MLGLGLAGCGVLGLGLARCGVLGLGLGAGFPLSPAPCLQEQVVTVKVGDLCALVSPDRAVSGTGNAGGLEWWGGGHPRVLAGLTVWKLYSSD